MVEGRQSLRGVPGGRDHRHATARGWGCHLASCDVVARRTRPGSTSTLRRARRSSARRPRVGHTILGARPRRTGPLVSSAMPEIRSAEIVSVGTELPLGEVIDTTGARLAADLAARGVDVYRSQRVGDNLDRIREAIEHAVRRSDLVVVGGGLGPTDDDRTRDAIAAVAGQPQRVDPDLERWLRERFASFGRAMPERNLQQARVIDAATVLPNPIGTAPGWLVRLRRDGSERVIVTLPGPPREFDRMWQREAVPLLAFPPDHLFVRTFKTIGIGESHVAERLGDLTHSSNPTVATYAKRDGVHVRVAAKAENREAATRLARATVDQVEARIGSFVWGSDGDELADLALRELVAR